MPRQKTLSQTRPKQGFFAGFCYAPREGQDCELAPKPPILTESTHPRQTQAQVAFGNHQFFERRNRSVAAIQKQSFARVRGDNHAPSLNNACLL